MRLTTRDDFDLVVGGGGIKLINLTLPPLPMFA
jgi:hypothetical protein